MSLPPAQLSCLECQRRKTRCNKQLPACSACVTAGITCTVVQRPRLPRGRTSKKVSQRRELKSRIERLETVLLSLGRRVEDLDSTQSGRETLTQPVLDSFVAPEFWKELSETIVGMREVLESPENPLELDLDSNLNLKRANDEAQVLNLSVISRTTLFPSTTQVFTPSKLDSKEESYLLEIYRTRVHPIFRILHWPSTLASLELAARLSYEGAEASDLQALRAAICFAAMCSFHHHELLERPHGVDHYRMETEAGLTRAALFTTTSLVTLQAFVIYLVGLRACQANAQQWTLTALAIRIANAQGIPSRLCVGSNTFNEQLKRRLWYSIGVLDLQSALDRGSKPLLPSSDLEFLPCNYNDDNLHMDSVTSVPIDDQFTEMSFSIITYRGGLCQRRLTEVGLSAASGDLDPKTARREQLTELSVFETHVEETLQLCDVPPTTIQAFTQAAGKEAMVTMRLLLHRPLHHRGQIPPSTTYMEAQDFDVLAMATEVLERSQYKRSEGRFAQWAWFSWIKWYALAVVLAELCTISGNAADHSWKVAQRSYEDYANVVADTKSGLLWKPIAKLMLKVKQLRGYHGVDALSETQIEARASLWPPKPASSGADADMPVAGWSGTEQMDEMGNSTSFAQTTVNYTGVPSAPDDLWWTHWDMLIDDINDPNLIGEDQFLGLLPLDQLR